MARNDDNDPTDTQNQASAAPPVPPTLNSPPPALPPGFTERPTATNIASGIVRPVPSAGSATVNGRAISPDEINRLANTNVIPTASFTNPGIGTIGQPVSPDQGLRVAALNIQRPSAQTSPSDAIPRPFAIERPGTYDPSDAASRYRSDVADIINKDPRSVLGTAAHNAAADLAWDRNTGQDGLARTNYQNAVGTLLGGVQREFDARNQAGNSNARDQTQWADSVNTNEANVARSGVLADGRIGAAQTRADAMSYGADTRADATRYAADARANAPKVDSAADAAYSRAYQAALQNGGTTDEARAAAGKVRSDLLRLRLQGNAGAQQQDDYQPSAPPVQNGSPQASASRQPQQQLLQPTVEAIQYLQSKPHLAEQFDAKYGKGVAAQYLNR